MNQEALRLLVSVLIAPTMAQVLKIFWYKKRYKKIDFHVILHDGGMPSAHTATVSALVVGTYLSAGFTSLFVIALVFALIVMRDATGIRRSTGQMAEVLNSLLHEHHLHKGKLKEVLGHSPLQVLVGVIVGAIVTLIVFSL